MNRFATDRGHKPPSERPRRELPVLFHLMDVSRPRVSAPVSDSLAPAIDRLPAVAKPIVESPIVEPAVAELPPASLSPPELVTNSQPTPPADRPTSSSISTGPRKFSLSQPIELCTTPSEPAADSPSTTLTSDSSASEELKGVAQHPVTPRPPFDGRRKFRMPLSEDWFAAHGKYIAVVFVLGLIGTVYLARTNRRPAPHHAASESQTAASDKSDKTPAGEPPAIVMQSTAPLHSSSGASSSSPQLVDKASATVDKASATTEARTELFPPVAPSLAAKPAADGKATSGDNLFVFPQTKKPEERVATRPESAQSIANPTMPAPAAPAAAPAGVSTFAQPPAPSAAPAAPVPALAPAYPTTSTPMPTYPITSPPQHAYPTTAAPPLTGPAMPAMPPRVAPGQPAAYGPAYPSGPAYPPTNTYQPPPAPPQGSATWQPPTAQAPPAQVSSAPGTWSPPSPGGWMPPAPNGGMPPQYQPPDNTARGFRNERTGSSLY